MAVYTKSLIQLKNKFYYLVDILSIYSYHLTAWDEPEYSVLVNILKSNEIKVN